MADKGFHMLHFVKLSMNGLFLRGSTALIEFGRFVVFPEQQTEFNHRCQTHIYHLADSLPDKGKSYPVMFSGDKGKNP